MRRMRRGELDLKTVLLFVAVLAVVGASAWWARRRSPERVLAATDDQFPVEYVCEACGHKFQMTYGQAWELIRQGKAESRPGQYRRFPCPKCGQVKAVVREGVRSE